MKFVLQVMVNVSFVILMFVHAHLSGFVMNVIMDHTKEDVLFVGVLVFQMLITVKNAQCRKRM